MATITHSQFLTHNNFQAENNSTIISVDKKDKLTVSLELIKSLSKARYFTDSAPSSGFENEFFPGLPEELFLPALACLALARDQPELLEFESSRVVNSYCVPFVPLPSDMFAKKHDKEDTQIGLTDNNQMDCVSDDNGDVYKEDKSSASVFGKETDEPEKDEKESDWLMKITELHKVSDLESVEENAPEKMPMRKGENQYVVSRKKDRSLTSPPNKRRMSIETKDSDFLPFVPFPPDYFAKHKQPEETTRTTTYTIPAPATKNASQVVQEEPRENQW
ncbi:hypothetical protein N665_0189s0081 [Sinapis alba]|nr:hypothetical protein N665_0189s0081 [Sinapis alba]